jgi:glycine cleavage system aminomethyltransferase T
VQLPDGYLARDTAETAVPFGISLEHDFIGRARVESSMKTGARWHGLLTLERGPSPRPGHEVLSSEEENSKLVGYVTSGGPAPSLSRSGIAMAYLEGVEIGDELWIQASSRRRVKVKVVKLPFV